MAPHILVQLVQILTQVLACFRCSNGVLVMVGLPGSGKTQLAQLLATEMQLLLGQAADVRRIVFDDIYKAMSDERGLSDFDPMLWHESREKAFDMVDHFLETEPPADTLCRIAIVDDNMYYRSMRNRFYRLAKHRA